MGVFHVFKIMQIVQNRAYTTNIPILYPWKHQKTKGFLVFSGGGGV